MKSKILISTGGSGGHVLPAITIYDHLKSNYETLISTDLRGLRYLDKENYKHIIVNTPKFNNLLLFPFSILKVIILTFKSLIILKKENISILISTGGYMSLPLCLAAKILSIKIYLIEPNMVLGRANKFFLYFAKKLICYSKELINLPKKFKYKQTIVISKGMKSMAGRVSNKLKMFPTTTEHVIFFYKDSRDLIKKFLQDKQKEFKLT